MATIDQTLSVISSINTNANRLIEYELEKRGHRGLAPSHGNILYQLITKGEMTKKELSECIGKDCSTVTALIRKLTQLGYIETRPHNKDRRFSIVFLTPKGKEMKKDFMEISELLFRTQYAGMGEEQVRMFTEALQVMNNNFSRWR